MDKVYQKPLPIAEFGNLLVKVRFIESIPPHLLQASAGIL